MNKKIIILLIFLSFFAGVGEGYYIHITLSDHEIAVKARDMIISQKVICFDQNITHPQINLSIFK
jgi:hypothetical protein